MFTSQINKKNGFAIVEGLAATFIIALSLTSFVTYLATSSFGVLKTARTKAQMLDLEIRMVAGLSDENNFSKSAVSQMQSGTVPVGFVVKSEGVTIAENGEALFFDVDGNRCAAYDPNKCFIKTELKIKCAGSCMAAYRVSSIHNDGKEVELQPLGAGVENNGAQFMGFADKDFYTAVPLHLMMKEAKTECVGNELMMNGFDIEAREIFCLRLSTDLKCQPNQIAKRVRYIGGDGGSGGSIGLECEDIQKISCPDNYVLNSIDPSSLDPGQTKVGTCVYIAKSSMPWKNKVIGTGKVSAVVCPTGYKATNISCKGTGKPVKSGTVDCSFNGTSQCSCSADVNAFTIQSGVGATPQEASCVAVKKAQTCNNNPRLLTPPSISVVLEMDGQCELVGSESVTAK